MSEIDDFTTNDGYDWRYFARIGRITVAWSRVEGVLKQLLVDLVGGNDWTIYSLTADMQASRIIEKCRMLMQQLREPDLSAVREWLDLADAARITRNQVMHGSWVAIRAKDAWQPAQLAIQV